MIEKQQVEYKSIWKKDILEEICGAANAKGGIFLIGKDNNGKTIGLTEKEADELLTKIPNQIVQTMHYYDVTVDAIEDENGLLYIEIDVQKSSHPVFYQGKMYKRIGSANFPVEGREQQSALIEMRNQSWDSTLVEGVSIADLDEDSFDIFKEEAIRSGMLKGKNLDDPGKILEELELIKDGKLTTAAVLLFHKQPSKIISGAKVEIGKMRNEGDVVNKEEIKGSLMTLSRSILDILQVKYLSSLISYDGAKRIETSPYPFNALREAVFNSLMHNDWSTGQSILIKVFDHKLVISNRSIIEKDWTVEKHSSRHINPLISSTFSKAGFVEKFGTGISKILESCKSEGNPEPIFDAASDGFDFTVTFEVSKLYLALEEYREKMDPKNGFVDYRKVIASIDSGTVKDVNSIVGDLGNDPNDSKVDPDIDPNDPDIIPEGIIIPETIRIPQMYKKLVLLGKNPMMYNGRLMTLSDLDRNIYELIKYNPKITYSQIASILKISRKTVSRYIASLRERELIQFDGHPRNGKWIVIKEYSKKTE